jgi:hypothetical protein
VLPLACAPGCGRGCPNPMDGPIRTRHGIPCDTVVSQVPNEGLPDLLLRLQVGRHTGPINSTACPPRCALRLGVPAAGMSVRDAHSRHTNVQREGACMGMLGKQHRPQDWRLLVRLRTARSAVRNACLKPSDTQSDVRPDVERGSAHAYTRTSRFPFRTAARSQVLHPCARPMRSRQRKRVQLGRTQHDDRAGGASGRAGGRRSVGSLSQTSRRPLCSVQ